MRAMRLRTWLMLGYGTVLAVAGLGLVLGLLATLDLADTSRRMVDEDFDAIDAAAQIRRLGDIQQLQLFHLPDRLAEAEVPGFVADARALVAQARVHAQDELETRRLADIDDALDDLNERWHQPHDVLFSVDALISDVERVREAAFALYRLRYDRMVERGRALNSQALRLAYALGLLAVLTTAVGVWASLRIARGLSRPMEHLVRASDLVATGDFTVRTARSGLVEADRVAQRFDEMVAALERFHAMNIDRVFAERRRLDQVVAQIDDGLVIFDAEGNIERVNPVAAKQLGVNAEGCVGCRVETLVDTASLRDDVNWVLRQPNAQLSGDNTLSINADGGGARTLSYSLIPFSETSRLGLLLVLRDITDQRRFERLRTEFILRASHELRTPITSTRMALGLLRDRVHFAPASREDELFQTLQQETERIVVLITELFDLSRLYTGPGSLDTRATDPTELLQRARQRFAPLAETAAISLALRLPPALPTVSLDEQAIGRVLDNLLNNALRHTPSGGRVELGASVDEREVAIWVADTGEGIAPADRARVFEPFVQFGERAGGAGLGLAMCREIVQQHGGRIDVDSVLGQGSRFTLLLPIVGADAARR